MSENSLGNPDRLTYSESRTINVGQYENVSSSFTYSGNIRHYNKQDKTVEISHNESISIPDYGLDYKYTAKLLLSRVKKVLNTREQEIRLASRPFVETEAELTDKSFIEFDNGDLL
jgi:LysM repeat protein